MEKRVKDTFSNLLHQYDTMKAKHPDAILMFRVGDFYEMFKDDAITSSEILGITLSRRSIAGKDKPIDFTGFPHYALDTYLPKLVRAGKRIAICEQLEDPKQQKEKDNNMKKDTKKQKSPSAGEEEPKKGKSKSVENTKSEKVSAENGQKKDNSVKNTDGAKVENEVKQKREPQMITVNGQKVTHGHAYQGNVNPENWYFTAKLDGAQLKPQLMTKEDLAAYSKKELTVPQLMEKYYPTKLMEKVPSVAFSLPNAIAGPEGSLTVNKFNVYKEKDPARDDFGKYKFYAQVDDKKMSAIASKRDLDAYFDRVATPADLVTKYFGEQLHMKAAYEKYSLPEGVESKDIRIAKAKDGKWYVSANLGEKGQTSRVPLSFDDGFSYFQTKTATREQIGAKYLNNEITKKLSMAQAQKNEVSMKM